MKTAVFLKLFILLVNIHGDGEVNAALQSRAASHPIAGTRLLAEKETLENALFSVIGQLKSELRRNGMASDGLVQDGPQGLGKWIIEKIRLQIKRDPATPTMEMVLRKHKRELALLYEQFKTNEEIKRTIVEEEEELKKPMNYEDNNNGKTTSVIATIQDIVVRRRMAANEQAKFSATKLAEIAFQELGHHRVELENLEKLKKKRKTKKNMGIGKNEEDVKKKGEQNENKMKGNNDKLGNIAIGIRRGPEGGRSNLGRQKNSGEKNLRGNLENKMAINPIDFNAIINPNIWDRFYGKSKKIGKNKSLGHHEQLRDSTNARDNPVKLTRNATADGGGRGGNHEGRTFVDDRQMTIAEGMGSSVGRKSRRKWGEEDRAFGGKKEELINFISGKSSERRKWNIPSVGRTRREEDGKMKSTIDKKWYNIAAPLFMKVDEQSLKKSRRSWDIRPSKIDIADGHGKQMDDDGNDEEELESEIGIYKAPTIHGDVSDARNISPTRSESFYRALSMFRREMTENGRTFSSWESENLAEREPLTLGQKKALREYIENDGRVLSETAKQYFDQHFSQESVHDDQKNSKSIEEVWNDIELRKSMKEKKAGKNG